MKNAKAIVAAIGTITTSLSAALADEVMNNNEIAGLTSTVVLAVLTVWGVWRVENKETNS